MQRRAGHPRQRRRRCRNGPQNIPRPAVHDRRSGQQLVHRAVAERGQRRCSGRQGGKAGVVRTRVAGVEAGSRRRTRRAGRGVRVSPVERKPGAGEHTRALRDRGPSRVSTGYARYAVPRRYRPRGGPHAPLRRRVRGGRKTEDRGGTGERGNVLALVVGEPRTRLVDRVRRNHPRREALLHSSDHPGTPRRAPFRPGGTPPSEDHVARRGRRLKAVRHRRRSRPGRRHVRLPPARRVVRRIPRRPLFMGTGQQRIVQPLLRGSIRHAVCDLDRKAGRVRDRQGLLGRSGRTRGRGDRKGEGRTHRPRQELGACDGCRRRDGPSGALPRPLPFTRRRAIPAPRPPQPGQLQPRHVAQRHRRRRATRAIRLRLHRRQLPGMAAARRRHRRRVARFRVRTPPDEGPHRTRPATPGTPPQAMDEHERPGLVQRRLPRPLPLTNRGAPRGARRGPRRGQSAPIAVGQPLHEQGGLHRRPERLRDAAAASSM